MPGDNLNSRVGSLLRASRSRILLSQERLAERAGTSQQWLSRVERGAVNLKLGDAERLFGVLGLRLAIATTSRADEPDVDPDLVSAGDAAEELGMAVDRFGSIWRRFAAVRPSLSIMVGDHCLPVVPLADLLRTAGDVGELARRLSG